MPGQRSWTTLRLLKTLVVFWGWKEISSKRGSRRKREVNLPRSGQPKKRVGNCVRAAAFQRGWALF